MYSILNIFSYENRPLEFEPSHVSMVCIIQSIMELKVLYGRSKYFKTALSTDVGNQNKVIKVEECSADVLATVIDFMYGISVPEDLSNDDAKSLLTMADLYLMDDLKDALASLLAKQLSKDNILEMIRMAEKFTAQRLMELCCDFIHANIGDLDNSNNALDELFPAMPMVAKLCFQRQLNKMDVMNEVLGVNLATSFKKRKDFQSDLEYKFYMMSNMKPKMLVLCNKDSSWN